ncbi:hypothetical protein AMTR_s00072p00113290 [Amborella trichopoda]|uniref:Uncharacterized protein n=1 Tax=Amborella trichopoda TaxID=13333 RepID=W1NUT7_AMBTC|nr:hypothetical protein AMTR_s00072p00113290 [Amborella trichopoda]
MPRGPTLIPHVDIRTHPHGETIPTVTPELDRARVRTLSKRFFLLFSGSQPFDFKTSYPTVA